MDSRIGLDYIVENRDYTDKLGAGELLNEGWYLGHCTNSCVKLDFTNARCAPGNKQKALKLGGGGISCTIVYFGGVQSPVSQPILRLFFSIKLKCFT